MRQSRQIDIRNLAAHDQIDDLAVRRVTGCADNILVTDVEEEVIQIVVEPHAPNGKSLRLLRHSLVAVIVHDSVVHGIVAVLDLPEFFQILECDDEAFTRWGVVNRAHPRTDALVVFDPDDFLESEVFRIQDDQAVGQVVRHHRVAPVGGNGHIARVYSGSYLREHAQAVEVEHRYPPVPGGEVHEAPVRGELGSAMKRVTCSEAVDGGKRVAVEHRDVMVTRFDDHKEIHGIGCVAFFRRVTGGQPVHDAARFDLRLPPDRQRGERRVDELRQGLDIGFVELVRECRHLGCGQAFADGGDGLTRLQAAQVLRKQGRAGASEAPRTVTAGAVSRVDRSDVFLGLRRAARRANRDKGGGERSGKSQASPPPAGGATCTRLRAGGRGGAEAALARAAVSAGSAHRPISPSLR